MAFHIALVSRSLKLRKQLPLLLTDSRRRTTSYIPIQIKMKVHGHIFLKIVHPRIRIAPYSNGRILVRITISIHSITVRNVLLIREMVMHGHPLVTRGRLPIIFRLNCPLIRRITYRNCILPLVITRTLPIGIKMELHIQGTLNMAPFTTVLRFKLHHVINFRNTTTLRFLVKILVRNIPIME